MSTLHSETGSLLVEFLITMTLMSMLAAASGYALKLGLEQQRRDNARQFAHATSSAMRSYWLNTPKDDRHWPTSVKTLVDAGLIKAVPKKYDIELVDHNSSAVVKIHAAGERTFRDEQGNPEPISVRVRVPIDPRTIDSASALDDGQFGIIQLLNYPQGEAIFGIAQLSDLNGVEVWNGLSQGSFLMVNSLNHKAACPLEYEWAETRDVLYGPFNLQGQVYVRGYYHESGKDRPIQPGTREWEEGIDDEVEQGPSVYEQRCHHLGAIAHGMNDQELPPDMNPEIRGANPLPDDKIWTRQEFQEAKTGMVSPPNTDDEFPHLNTDRVPKDVLGEGRPMILRRLIDQ